ncbi:unnamed protein product [Oncorhynchus mykiss]|uniref:Uncharacterized protein n=1 Tax=Oncorhynchus mykiss TaxID=8022 RepID=A0A060YSJ2_ONCMY|nr:unnamed protein product [Oncorhynchus mykiss]
MVQLQLGLKENLGVLGRREGKETEDSLVSRVLQVNQEPQVSEVEASPVYQATQERGARRETRASQASPSPGTQDEVAPLVCRDVQDLLGPQGSPMGVLTVQEGPPGYQDNKAI